MTKLVSMLIAAAFTAVSFQSIAADAKKEEKKTEAKQDDKGAKKDTKKEEKK